jgi:peroxiredoxin
MNYVLIFGLVTGLATSAICCWLSWQMLQQNGRMLLRLEALEKRLEEEAESSPASDALRCGEQRKAENEQDGLAAAANGDERAGRFSNHSLTGSKIKRDGLKAGTSAPEFCLPRLDGGELSLSELRGKLVLLVFSSPHCAPCNMLAPTLQKFHRKHPELELVMVSSESLDENRAKVKEHGLAFPVLLQKHWEVSRDYAMFAAPVAYLIDKAGIVAADVAVGVDGVLDLMPLASRLLRKQRPAGLLRRLPKVLGLSRERFRARPASPVISN